MDAAVIFNARSGPLRESSQNPLANLLSKYNIRARLMPCNEGQSIGSHAEEAVKLGYSLVVAAGGDGTISAVAGVLLGSERTLGIIPAGTFNHFARDLGIPTDFEGAVKTLRSSRDRMVDTGSVSGRTFLNTSSIGLYTRLVLERERYRRLGAGRLQAILTGGILSLRRFDRFYVRIRTQDSNWEGFTPFLFVGNNEYMIEGSRVAQRSTLDSGHLFVCVADSPSRASFVRLGLQAALSGMGLGRVSGNPDLRYFTTTELTVDCGQRPLHVSRDGEVEVMQPPLHYAIHPKSLRVRVP